MPIKPTMASLIALHLAISVIFPPTSTTSANLPIACAIAITPAAIAANLRPVPATLAHEPDEKFASMLERAPRTSSVFLTSSGFASPATVPAASPSCFIPSAAGVTSSSTLPLLNSCPNISLKKPDTADATSGTAALKNSGIVVVKMFLIFSTNRAIACASSEPFSSSPATFFEIASVKLSPSAFVENSSVNQLKPFSIAPRPIVNPSRIIGPRSIKACLIA